MEKEVYTAPLVEVRLLSDVTIDELEMVIEANMKAAVRFIDNMLAAGFVYSSEYLKAQEKCAKE